MGKNTPFTHVKVPYFRGEGTPLLAIGLSTYRSTINYPNINYLYQLIVQLPTIDYVPGMCRKVTQRMDRKVPWEGSLVSSLGRFHSQCRKVPYVGKEGALVLA